MLNNRPLKSKIALIVTPLMAIALYGMFFELYAAYQRYERAKELEYANATSDYILKAAGIQAKERGFTSTVLSNPQDKTTLAAISKLRSEGDACLDSALMIIRSSQAKNSVIVTNLTTLAEVRIRRDKLRTSNDEVLGKSSPDAVVIKQWIATQSALIMAEHTLAESMFVGESRLETILALNSSIKNSVFYASEFAGRERANIGAIIGSGKPIDAERYASLMQFRGIVQEHCDNILAFSKNTAVTPEIKAAIQQMQTAFLKDFEETRKAIYKAGTDSLGKTTVQYPISTAEWIKTSTKSINSILKVSDTVSSEVARLAAEERKVSFYAVFIAFGISLVLFAVILLSNKILVLIVARITKLRNAAKNVEEGNFGEQIFDNNKDEIGQLTASINAMIGSLELGISELESEKANVERKVEKATLEIREQQQQLQSSVEEMLRSVEAFSQGDLTTRLSGEHTGEIGRLFSGYNFALENVRKMMTRIIEETEHTASASTEITASIEHMAQGIQRQHEQANTIAISTEEMSKTIEETARNTTLVAKQSEEARDEAAVGGATLKKMIESVNNVNLIVKRSADSVTHLNGSSEQISAMSAAIAEIADQTNLLALNAAIEAARAGEQGRGFAVVADEVRKLAERTQQATKEISQLVNAIQQDTQSVVITMKQGVHEVEQTHALVQQTNASLERIIIRTKSISDFISQLAVTSEEQHSTSEDIAGNMGIMTMVVSQSASVSEQIANTSQTLNLMTLAVQNMLSTFRVKEQENKALTVAQ